jgi:hypothetical protein
MGWFSQDEEEKHEHGVVGAPLPEGYVPMRTSKPFLQREGSGGWHRWYIEVDGVPGLRWNSGLFPVDGFYGERAPLGHAVRPARLAVWQPFMLTTREVEGWHPSLVNLGQRLHGITALHGQEEYWKRWDGHAQRHRKQWLKQEGLTIREESIEDFITVYLRTPTKFPQEIFLHMLRGRARCHGKYLHPWVMREDKTGKALAGLVVLDAPEVGQSLHLAAFTHPDAFHRSAGVGMIEHWFQEGIRQNFKFLDFDLFWSKGDPEAWQGFSRFKGQFDVQYIRYPQPFTNYFFLGRRW